MNISAVSARFTAVPDGWVYTVGLSGVWTEAGQRTHFDLAAADVAEIICRRAQANHAGASPSIAGDHR